MFNPEMQKTGAPKAPEARIFEKPLSEEEIGAAFEALEMKAQGNPEASQEAARAKRLHARTQEILAMLPKKKQATEQAPQPPAPPEDYWGSQTSKSKSIYQ